MIMACLECGLEWQCLCSAVPSLTGPLALSLLMHENEYQRETNTGRWLVKALPDCADYLWQRRTPHPTLLERLNDPGYYSLLIYPSEHSEPVEQHLQHAQDNGQIPHFIVLDGTWQEAKKMLRKSAWLTLPHAHLTTMQTSHYQLRRNQQTGHLCTLEVASELLKHIHQPQQAQALTDFLDTFMKTLQADKSGHRLREHSLT
ncbi:DTW domain-containing protein [Vibrio metschnikovii]|uniref:tRNA-uridine aminocarboxypropyltransferase n=2 Tax=Unclassified Bacteria TaxID=49928 RepID=A0AAU6T0W8_UNCXX|nr:DTW domain-containing protein [Vibrio metschnikovii]EKO3569393.1 DTW domain-containing protein [Vibrio metschnikovii]EKO3576584.1 DTW domain-containing protein [Vibrio metschnikovii]EKO3586633.1 DTW domain-containing protein [Vibrio metschnikovii]EKO3597218.1 DTW domain-containing protein [Vibrio metschnikovii]